MNRLLDMPAVGRLLGIGGTDICRRTRRRLKAIAEHRPGDFQLFTLAGSAARVWYTTENDIRRLLPELFKHEEEDDSLASLVQRQAADLRALSKRIATLENLRLRKATP